MIVNRLIAIIFVSIIYTNALAQMPETPVTEMHIKGNIGELMMEGEFQISTSSGGLGMTDELVTVSVVDGDVDVRFTPGDTEVAWIAIQNPQGFLGKGLIVLEPGSFTVEVGGATEKLKVRGDGPLNNALFYSWKEEAQYKKLAQAYESVSERARAMPEGEQRSTFYKNTVLPAGEAYKAYETDALAAIALDDSDPVLARLATMNGGLGREEALARLDELQAVLGKSNRVDRYRSRAEAIKQAQNISQEFVLGATAADFTLPTLDGELITLSDVIAENELVLIEFWAVWCAPCRAEIPHMKRAYSAYANKGFEIVSISLDNNREDWEILSEEENIPWFNTSDLLAYGSPVIQEYGVLGIPKNYLVNSKREIIAKDLRQEFLDEALAARLGSE